MHSLFAVDMLVMGYILIDVFASALSYAIAGEFITSMNVVHTWDTIIFVVASDIFLAGGILLVVVIWNRFFKRTNEKSLGLLVLFPVSQSVFFCACSYQTWTVFGLDLMNNPFMLASILLSLVAVIAMCRALMQNTKTHELARKLTEMHHKMDMQLQYYEALAEKMQEVREYRHDINNLIDVTESLLRDRTSTGDGRVLLEDLKVKTANTRMPVFSSNPTVNAVLYHKQTSARELGVDFRVNMEVCEDFPFERSDICSVFANLLDNAVREASQTENGFTEISAGRRMGLLKSEVINSTSKQINSGRGRPATDKPDPEKHGFGLEIVESIVKKYDGKFVLVAENGIARAAVSLPLCLLSVNEKHWNWAHSNRNDLVIPTINE